jgi:threonine dehydrogenase-like Zn-dependent dehydrogenase
MKAVVLQSIGKVELMDVPIPTIRPDQMLIKTGAATICTSDLNDIRENPFGIELPVVIGHEGAGTVVEIGKDVKGFQVGDRVTTHPVHPCGHCEACRAGTGHLCLEMEHFGINLPGTMAEYYVVREDRARCIPQAMEFPLASLAEPVSVCLEALAQARLKPGDNLLIVGDGPFGVLIARLAEAFDLGKVVILGRHDFRMSFAPAAVKLNAKQVADPVAAARASIGGGFDAAILCVGTAQAFKECFLSLKPKGRLVVFSGISGETPVDLFWLHIKELEILGACNDDNRLDEAVQMLANPVLGIAELITHRLPLEEYRAGLDLAATGRERAMKVSFVF